MGYQGHGSPMGAAPDKSVCGPKRLQQGTVQPAPQIPGTELTPEPLYFEVRIGSIYNQPADRGIRAGECTKGTALIALEEQSEVFLTPEASGLIRCLCLHHQDEDEFPELASGGAPVRNKPEPVQPKMPKGLVSVTGCH